MCNLHWCYTFCSGVTLELTALLSANQNRVITRFARHYGDPAYGISRHIISPFRGAHLTPLKQQFNSDMSKVSNGDLVRFFAYLDFYKNLKVLLQPVGKYYAVGAHLTKCNTCLHGSVTSSFFGLEPPHLNHIYPISRNNVNI